MARMSLEVVAPTGPVAPPTDPETAAITCLLSVMEAHEAQDPATVGRCRRIAIHAVGAARALLLPAAEIDTIRLAALFCNLGLVRVPGTVLHKAEDLNESERQLIRQHPRLSAEMLATVPQLRQALPLVLYHHEFWNGEGYPYALREEQIPLGARIIHVAEAYEALTHARPYRRAYTAEEAEQMLIKGIDELRFTHVIILSSRGETASKVTGLDTGADDYLVKPFSTEELLALFDRAEARDFVDLHTLSERFDLDELLGLASDLDGGFTPALLAEMLASHLRFSD